MSFNEIPTQLLKYISSFFGIESLANFSITNKRHYKLFPLSIRLYNLIKKYNPSKNLQRSFDYFIQKNLKKKEKFSHTLLHYHCLESNISVEMIQFFIDKKFDLNQQDLKKEMALHIACKNKNVKLEVIKFMIENKSNLNHKSSEGVPLHWAARNENLSFEIINYLVQSKTDLNITSSVGNSALHWICIFFLFFFFFYYISFLGSSQFVSLDLLKLMVENGCDVNCKGKNSTSPIHWICLNENSTKEMIEYLLENKANLDVLNSVKKKKNFFFQSKFF